jgi:predicted O-linked N-acetylglucosamine transferase (SPINDLY family)
MERADPGRVPQLIAQARQLQRAGQLGPAAQLFAQVLELRPDEEEALRQSGMIALAARQYERAVHFFDRLTRLRTDDAPACNRLGIALAALGRHDDAIASYDRAIALAPHEAEAYVNRGAALARSNRLEAAITSFDLAIARDPDNASAHFNRGIALADLGRLDEAVASYDRVVAITPDFAAAHYNRGVALAAVKQPEAAVASYDRAIAARPDYALAHHNRAIALAELGRNEAALASFEAAIAIAPGHAPSHFNRGNILHALGRHEAAVASFDRAIAARPDYAQAHTGRGCALHELNLFDAAVASFDRAIDINPDHADAHYNRGRTLLKAKNYPAAARSFEDLLRIDPAFPFAPGILLHARMMYCDWTDYDDRSAAIRTALRAGGKCVDPFGYQGVSESEADLRRCAEIYAASEFPPPAATLAPRPLSRRTGRITVGYLCGEFREQATAVLMCGVFESHDKEKVRLVGFDNGWDDGSRYRKRIDRCFDEMVEIRRLGDLPAAQRIRAMNVDILVNLNGYFGEPRLGVFAYRPSPVQVNYLGFPGTIGVDYIDYLIADRIVIPEASRAHYAEKIVYLPDSYQANDRQRQVSDRPMTRAEFGLPQEAFVYCCFNNTYKITPGTFDSWMRILGRVPGSVLWMLDENPAATANLVREAARRGIGRERLVFSPRLPLPEHLARHALADLFLDTLPYNAHTTGSDALWAGLPVLTQTGTTFPGRVGTSLLTAVGLPELVTASGPQFEAKAVELAADRQQLQRIREKLAANRLRQPLFDTPLITRRLEAAYRMMFDRCAAGLAPEHFSVD